MSHHIDYVTAILRNEWARNDLIVRSGLTEETIDLARIELCNNAARIKSLLNHGNNERFVSSIKNNLPALLFWYDSSFVRVKLRIPRVSKKNKEGQKYEQPYQSENQLYFPPGEEIKFYDHKRKRIIEFVEGEKKALKLWQERKRQGSLDNYCIVGIPGVWGWSQNKQALPCLHDVPLFGRNVILSFDNDVITNPQVALARSQLCAFLRERGGTIYKRDLPFVADKMGVDDFLLEHTIDEFDELPTTIADDLVGYDISVVRYIEQIPHKDISWVVEGIISRGDINGIDGDSDIGKTTLIADIIRRATLGLLQPVIMENDHFHLVTTETTGKHRNVHPMNCLYCTTEGGASRLRQKYFSNIPANRLLVVDDLHNDRLRFPRDLQRLEAIILAYQIDLVVFDPIFGFISDCDTYRDSDIRDKVLTALQHIALKHNPAIVLLRHTVKSINQRNAQHAGQGSAAITASYRNQLSLGVMDDERWLTISKSNWHDVKFSCKYRIVPDDSSPLLNPSNGKLNICPVKVQWYDAIAAYINVYGGEKLDSAMGKLLEFAKTHKKNHFTTDDMKAIFGQNRYRKIIDRLVSQQKLTEYQGTHNRKGWRVETTEDMEGS